MYHDVWLGFALSAISFVGSSAATHQGCWAKSLSGFHQHRDPGASSLPKAWNWFSFKPSGKERENFILNSQNQNDNLPLTIMDVVIPISTIILTSFSLKKRFFDEILTSMEGLPSLDYPTVRKIIANFYYVKWFTWLLYLIVKATQRDKYCYYSHLKIRN